MKTCGFINTGLVSLADSVVILRVVLLLTRLWPDSRGGAARLSGPGIKRCGEEKSRMHILIRRYQSKRRKLRPVLPVLKEVFKRNFVALEPVVGGRIQLIHLNLCKST